MNTQKFEFVSAGNLLSGFVDTPADGTAKALIIIIQGYGETDVAGRTSYYDLRSHFTQLGISTVIWDKPGCGQSAGKFDADQPVESSAAEVQDAIRQLRKSPIPGAHKIGLWGLSRGGWIAPLAIAQDPDIAFWISVSGTDDKENFPYLLESNLRIEGRTEPQIKQLVGEWKRGFEITSRGGSYTDYLAATQNLRRDPFIVYLSGGKDEDVESFEMAKAQFLSGAFQVDKKTGLQIYVTHFREMLARVNMPVLAIFGEKDRNVDWRKTMALYAKTIGKNRRASLNIRAFPDGNHNLQQAATGGFREMIEMKERHMCDGYFEAMETWLRTNVLT
ncbi:alpha/beta hydrolase family protein [Asticcacaulis benevestitus]|uniref:Serine aminopeptidase S33 domain-containing protein n=1 Tax=Asticcacaulis benevestitus DSM 16100 = ATCC BAA-896 TaxID=1121022 RepID=V4QWW6_9CAUL|nr:alpha/beta hydrolase [Asticcacaulis benevestitus]ESQ83633.1 hypothetical protein ABENE_20185 [Asticcacaulis benevestitus DSM 16100 = ATCC BAA-896]